MQYQKSSLDWMFYGLTVLGIGLCFFWRRRGDLQYAGEFPGWSASSDSAATDGDLSTEQAAGLDGLPGTGDVEIVPDVWAQARPDDEVLDPTPMYLADPLAVPSDPSDPSDLPDRVRPADLVIDTQPGDVPEQRRPDDLD